MDLVHEPTHVREVGFHQRSESQGQHHHRHHHNTPVTRSSRGDKKVSSKTDPAKGKFGGDEMEIPTGARTDLSFFFFSLLSLRP
jgi:hypothetical protein